MNVEDIIIYCVAIKNAIESTLKARAWFSYMQERDEVTFTVHLPALHYRTSKVITQISDSMHIGTPAKQIGRFITDSIINDIMSAIKQ